MKKFTIYGFEFYSLGSNLLSCGMELISSTDRPKEILEKVKYQEPGFEYIWLNPSARCTDFIFYGVLGTKEQYIKFYEAQKEAQISKKMIAKFGWDNWPSREITEAYENELYKNYKDWWNK